RRQRPSGLHFASRVLAAGLSPKKNQRPVFESQARQPEVAVWSGAAILPVGFERMPFSAIVLDVNHRNARGTGFSYQFADAWQDAVLHRSGHELHQALLYINDQERGVACLSIAS